MGEVEMRWRLLAPRLWLFTEVDNMWLCRECFLTMPLKIFVNI